MWRTSDRFTTLEREVMEYAEAMSDTPLTVTDELAASLLKQLGPSGLLELTVVHRAGELLHAVEHRGRASSPQGLAARCESEAARRSLRRGMTDDPFVTHRSLLFTVAYELLGSAADAEDVVQETWLRWDRVDQSEIEDPRAYLARIVTRQSLNRLRTVKRRREEYVGEWLPEPLLTSPDVAEDVEFAESVSIAMLTVLETLKPAERAVFVLKEVFDFPYDDIAQAVEKSPAAVRQIAHRAREHVAARRPRIEVDRSEQQRVVDRFMAAIESGEVQLLLDVLAPDIVLVADGGGEVGAALRPIRGPKTVARLLSNFRSIVPRRARLVDVGQRRARRADRAPRRARHRDQPGRGERPRQPHLLDAQPPQARPARRGSEPRPALRRQG